MDISIAQSALVLLTVILMGVSLLLIVIPPVPVGVLEWAIAIIFGLLTGFTRLTPAAAVIITLLMIAGVTSDIWLPILGFRTGEQVSCMGLVAFFVGMIIGSAIIPIPILGTFIGGTVAVIAVEYAQLQEMRQAMRKGGKALKLIIYSMIAELVFAGAIYGVTLLSIATTGNLTTS